MRILFTCFHPVDPHVVKYLAANLKELNYEIYFAVVEKENIINSIIQSLGYKSKVIGHNKGTLIGKVINTFVVDFKLFKLARKFKPDLIFSPTSPYAGHVSKLLGIPHITWADTETASGVIKATIPFLDTLFIPKSYYKALHHRKAIRFDGYKEIAYLHPNYFQPNKSILTRLGLNSKDIIILMRFSALNAIHDIGLKSESINNEDQIYDFIQLVENKYNAKVFISMTERKLEHRFDKYRLDIPPSKYIDLLAYCSMYIGEGTTTASEAGVLGVPWINVQLSQRGYLIDQENSYGLGRRVESLEQAFKIAIDWLRNKNLKSEWSKKREKLLQEKIDVTEFLTWFIVNYPESQTIIRKDINYQYNFK